MKRELLKHLFATNSIMVSEKGFVTKSGRMYFFETDVRNGMAGRVNAEKFSAILFSLLKRYIGDKTLIMGVPETGTLIAMLLYARRLKETDDDFPVNILRGQPKEYQRETVYTVLPIEKNQDVLIIEDDVVTGNTLIDYVTRLKSLGLKNVTVVSIIDRKEKIGGLSVKDKVIGLGCDYHFLLDIDDIAKYAREIGFDFPINQTEP